MWFINLIIVGLALCLVYTILSYIFKIHFDILFVIVLICIGNIIYLRWCGGGIEHIIPAIVIGGVAGGISGFAFMMFYFIIEDNVLKELDWERPLCFGPEQCPRCGSTRIGKHIYPGSSYDEIIEDHSCHKCGYYWNYSKT